MPYNAAWVGKAVCDWQLTAGVRLHHSGETELAVFGRQGFWALIQRSYTKRETNTKEQQNSAHMAMFMILGNIFKGLIVLHHSLDKTLGMQIECHTWMPQCAT